MKVLLVSRELAPHYGGGIGTYAAAMAGVLADAGHEVDVLTAPHATLTQTPAERRWRVHTVDLDSGRAAVDAYPAYAMRYAMAAWEAVERLHAQRGPFDLIEFPDYHAEGYFAVRAKRTLGRFERSLLAVRLHSASWVCMEADRDPRLTLEHAHLHHMERSALAECDVIVAPGRRVLERIRPGSGEEPNPAMRSLRSVPREAVIPIPVDSDRVRRELGEGTDPAPELPEVLFFGKLQHLKGPQDLVAAGVALLDRGVRARFRLIGNDSPTGPFGRSMLEFLRSRIPARWTGSFTFEPARERSGLGGAIRAAAASGGVCCFPSRWEAFPMVCLEAMALGAPVVCSDAGGLAEIVENGASGVAFPAGDAAALADALERALADSSLRERLARAGEARVRALCEPARVVRAVEELVSTDRAWADGEGAPTARVVRPAPAASIIIPCYNLGRYLPETLASVHAQTRRDFETIVIDDGSTDPQTIRLLDGLGPDVRVVRKPNAGLSEARNTALREAGADWVIPLDADDLVAPTLVEKLLAAADRHPGLDYVSPLVSYFEDDPAKETGGWVPLGPDRDLLLVRNVGGAASGSLIRREAALRIGGYDPCMTSYEDWEFWCRMAAAGCRGTVIPEFLLWYRVRADSMFRTEATSRHAALHAYIIQRHGGLAADPSRVMRILQSLADADPMEVVKGILRDNIRYRVVDRLNDALKRAGVHGAIKGIAASVWGSAERNQPR